MISKERLEDLIIYQETIYSLHCGYLMEFNLVDEVDSNSGKILHYEVDDDCLMEVSADNEVFYAWSLEYLFELEEDAKWASDKFAAKEIYFKPLMWKEIQKDIDRIKNTKDNLLIIPTQTFDNGSSMYALYLCKSDDKCSIEITDSEDSESVFKRFDFSEDGYVQAVEWARELFLGTKDD